MDAVILIGVPGAGKSTLYRQRFSETHERLSLDDLKSRDREHRRMQECIAAGKSFVVDDTNIHRADRATFIAAARQASYRVIAYFFRLELRAAIKRNSLRSGKQVVPIPGLIRSWKRLETPTLLEGFDEIWAVDVQPDGSLAVNPYSP